MHNEVWQGEGDGLYSSLKTNHLKEKGTWKHNGKGG